MRRRSAPLLAVLVALAAAPAARADAYDEIFKEYQSSGRIDPCAHSEADLEQARSQIPNDIDAYAPDFRNALQAATEVRAGGACRTPRPGAAAPEQDAGTAPAAPGATSTLPPGPPAAGGSTVTPAPPAEPTAAPAADDRAIADAARTAQTSDAGTPAPLIALGLIGALLALGGLAYALVHWLAWDPRWAQRSRHALGEAGWRTGNTWSEFADWVRLRR